MNFELEYPEFFKTLGIEIVEVSKGNAKLKMSYRKEITQSFGMVHGGAIFSLADSCCAVAVLSILKEKRQFVTAEMKINFTEPVTRGDIFAISRIVREGRVIPVEADIYNDERLVAKALGTYIILDQKSEK